MTDPHPLNRTLLSEVEVYDKVTQDAKIDVSPVEIQKPNDTDLVIVQKDTTQVTNPGVLDSTGLQGPPGDLIYEDLENMTLEFLPGTWTNLELANNWGLHPDSNYPPPRAQIIGDRVYFQGLAVWQGSTVNNWYRDFCYIRDPVFEISRGYVFFNMIQGSTNPILAYATSSSPDFTKIIVHNYVNISAGTLVSFAGDASYTLS